LRNIIRYSDFNLAQKIKIDKMASSECSAGRAEDCNRLVYEAVNEISVSKFQLVISSYSEIEVLTSLAKSNEKGETEG
jgi:hypothetical protein